VKLVYFASVRERIGRPEEEIDLPPEIKTAGDLVAWLQSRGPEYEAALSEPRAVRMALDHVHARADARLDNVREVAIFPPMTGG